MLKLRRQLPAYSPIRFRSLLAGLEGALGLGRPRARLRARLADHYGTSDVLLTDSGTSALLLAIRGAIDSRSTTDAPDGSDAVALPAYCCYDVATAAIGAGARARLYDIDSATLGPDPDSLDGVLKDGVAAVVAVHQYGIPVDMARLAERTAAHGALLIDDAAQGFGGSIGDRPLGALGSLGVLSFGRGKGITGGGGGALLANDDAGRRALAAIAHVPARGRLGWGELAKLVVQWLLGRPSLYGIPASLPWLGLGETHYAAPWPPRGIARAAAAAVLANWNASVREAEVRRENAGVIRRIAADRFEMPSSPAARSVPGALRLPVLARSDGFPAGAESRVRRAGLERGYPYLPALPALGTCLSEGCTYSHASDLSARLWTVPTHSRTEPMVTINSA